MEVILFTANKIEEVCRPKGFQKHATVVKSEDLTLVIGYLCAVFSLGMAKTVFSIARICFLVNTFFTFLC